MSPRRACHELEGGVPTGCSSAVSVVLLGAAGLDRRTVCSPAPRKMSVERRCDAPDQELCAISYGKPAIVNHHDAIFDKALDSRTIDGGELRIQSVTTGCLGEIDCHLAHDSLDDLGAEAILLRQKIALRGGEPILGDASKVVLCRDSVHDEPLLHAPDSAGAETNEGVRAIVSIALEIALQPAVLLRRARLSCGRAK